MENRNDDISRDDDFKGTAIFISIAFGMVASSALIIYAVLRFV